jgi:hypothetical protein
MFKIIAFQLIIQSERTNPSLKMNLLNVIIFIPNSGINMASFFRPGPAFEMAEKTVLQFLLA